MYNDIYEILQGGDISTSVPSISSFRGHRPPLSLPKSPRTVSEHSTVFCVRQSRLVEGIMFSTCPSSVTLSLCAYERYILKHNKLF